MNKQTIMLVMLSLSSLSINANPLLQRLASGAIRSAQRVIWGKSGVSPSNQALVFARKAQAQAKASGRS
jgi:acetylornithine/succinyldiaminopimelate/putrescine aminotransferase